MLLEEGLEGTGKGEACLRPVADGLGVSRVNGERWVFGTRWRGVVGGAAGVTSGDGADRSSSLWGLGSYECKGTVSSVDEYPGW